MANWMGRISSGVIGALVIGIFFTVILSVTNARFNAHMQHDKLPDADGLKQALLDDEEFVEKLRRRTPTGKIPSGAVVAFLSTGTRPCPNDEWSIYEEAMGRFIVGAGLNNENVVENNVILSDYQPSDTGGAETHKLTMHQIGAHTHTVDPHFHSFEQSNVSGNSSTWSFGGGSHRIANELSTKSTSSSETSSIGSAGLSQAHNNMPPYIALYFCKKE